MISLVHSVMAVAKATMLSMMTVGAIRSTSVLFFLLLISMGYGVVTYGYQSCRQLLTKVDNDLGPIWGSMQSQSTRSRHCT